MWLFTEHGFLSIVQDREKSGRFLLVRARKKEDLDEFIWKLRGYIGVGNVPPIFASPDRDYAYRMSVPTNLAAVVIMEMVGSIDYDNFKNRVHDNDACPHRNRAYLKVWQTMSDFQHDVTPAPVDSGGQRNKSKAARRRRKNKVRAWKG